PRRSSHARPRPSHPTANVRDDREAPLFKGRRTCGKVLVICPTAQVRSHATRWHDGQFAHGSMSGEQFVGWAKPPGRANARPMTGVPTTIVTLIERWWARRKSAFAHPTTADLL